MKICPKCKTPNQDKNYYCVECNAVITGAQVVDDSAVMEKSMKKFSRKENSRKFLLPGIIIFVTLVMDSFLIWLGASARLSTGAFDFKPLFIKMLWYIPIFVLMFLNVDGIYQKIRKKKGLPEKHLPDVITIGVVAVAILLWFFLQCEIAGNVLFVNQY